MTDNQQAVTAPELRMSNGCATVDAMDRQTAAIQELTSELKAAVDRVAPAADALLSLGDAQKKLCAWLVGHRLKIAAAVPVVLVSVGAISPNAAHLIAQLLQAWGVQ